jgi:hypothetical protein
MSKPNVAIVVPSGDMMHATFAMALARICTLSQGAVALHLINSRSSIVATARNTGVDLALKAQTDFVLFLDSDMDVPPTTLLQLLAHQRDIVGATYVKRVPPHEVIGTALAEQPLRGHGGLIEMERIPTGCLLIATKVFATLPRPFFRFGVDAESGTVAGEDFLFCDAVREAGFRIWCDPSLTQQIGHIGQQVYRMPTDTGLTGQQAAASAA